jgi:septum formation protein
MITTDIPIYLATRSPRRKKLLKQLNIKFHSFSVDLKEEILDGEHPVQTVKRLANEKMRLASKKADAGIFITADTLVVYDKHVLGKPKNKRDAEKILKMLSGETHHVYTGFMILNKNNKKQILDYERTAVTFRRLNIREIKDYVSTGNPMDKAGGYGIQDEFGAVFVEKISGCYYNVMGLPLSKIYYSLKEIL